MNTNGANKTKDQPEISQGDLDPHETFDRTTAKMKMLKARNHLMELRLMRRWTYQKLQVPKLIWKISHTFRTCAVVTARQPHNLPTDMDTNKVMSLYCKSKPKWITEAYPKLIQRQ